MQKKIIALAVAAVASGAAFAQSNVTIYGNLDAGYQSLTGTHRNGTGAYTVGSATAASINGINNGLNKSSMIGFKGEEALGNGMKAVFTAEYNVNVDGAAASAQAPGTTGMEASFRQSYVGVSGNFGTLTVGRHYTPFFLVAKAVDPFGAVGVASILAIHPVGVGAVTRASNSMNYVSPNINGFTVGALYGMGEENTTGAVSNSTASLKGVYSNGPLLVGAAFIRLADNIANGQHLYSTAIGGAYKFAPLTLSLMYNSLRSSSSTTNIDNGDWLIGLQVPMGMGTIKAAINRGNDKTAANKDATHVGLGYQYDLSKRTNMYVQYGNVSNNQDGRYGLTSGANLAALGANGAVRTTGLSLGMGHSF
ncbi:MAG: porin [Sulfurisoma sp.]|nr:porin [Sulfurisoma sp.]